MFFSTRHSSGDHTDYRNRYSAEVPAELLEGKPLKQKIEIVLGYAWNRYNNRWDTAREGYDFIDLDSTDERTTFGVMYRGRVSHRMIIEGNLNEDGPW